MLRKACALKSNVQKLLEKQKKKIDGNFYSTSSTKKIGSLALGGETPTSRAVRLPGECKKGKWLSGFGRYRKKGRKLARGGR